MSNTIKINIYHILLVLFIASLASSLIISTQPISEICDTSSGCDIVQHSRHAETFGIKNSHFGVVVFSLLSIVTYLQLKNPTKQKKQFIYLGIIISSIIAIYFIYLQQFILEAYCKYCMVVDISMLIALGLITSNYKRKNET